MAAMHCPHQSIRTLPEGGDVLPPPPTQSRRRLLEGRDDLPPPSLEPTQLLVAPLEVRGGEEMKGGGGACMHSVAV
jgi:hypothetical protein